MFKCPKCGNKITFWQDCKHTRWTPIVCKNCKAKLTYSQKELSRVFIPPVIYCLIVFLIISFVPRTTPKTIKLPIGIILIIGVIFTAINLSKGFKSIKLEIKDKE